MVPVPAFQPVQLVLEVIGKMPEYPVPLLLKEIIQAIGWRSRADRKATDFPGGQEALLAMEGQVVPMVIQENKNVEPGGPVQHIRFDIGDITRRKIAVCARHVS
jgi:hypothetical protein